MFSLSVTKQFAAHCPCPTQCTTLFIMSSQGVYFCPGPVLQSCNGVYRLDRQGEFFSDDKVIWLFTPLYPKPSFFWAKLHHNNVKFVSLIHYQSPKLCYSGRVCKCRPLTIWKGLPFIAWGTHETFLEWIKHIFVFNKLFCFENYHSRKEPRHATLIGLPEYTSGDIQKYVLIESRAWRSHEYLFLYFNYCCLILMPNSWVTLLKSIINERKNILICAQTVDTYCTLQIVGFITLSKVLVSFFV
jgi:hypothetical protein